MMPAVNTAEMMTYNVINCQVTLELCFELDLINQRVALCFFAKSYVVDVMLSSSGAIAASSLSSYVWEQGYRYSWTSDHRPEKFYGGQVHFKGGAVTSYPMVVDFVSMYPTIMTRGLISPESMDYLDFNTNRGPRFEATPVADYGVGTEQL